MMRKNEIKVNEKSRKHKKVFPADKKFMNG